MTIGTGPDHGLLSLYVDDLFHQTIDGYAVTPDELPIEIPLASAEGGAYVVELRKSGSKRQAATGYWLRFKSLVANRHYTLLNWDYTYDALSRVRSATANGTQKVALTYGFDVESNRTLVQDASGSVVMQHTYAYDDANRLQSSHFLRVEGNTNY